MPMIDLTHHKIPIFKFLCIDSNCKLLNVFLRRRLVIIFRTDKVDGNGNKIDEEIFQSHPENSVICFSLILYPDITSPFI